MGGGSCQTTATISALRIAPQDQIQSRRTKLISVCKQIAWHGSTLLNGAQMSLAILNNLSCKWQLFIIWARMFTFLLDNVAFYRWEKVRWRAREGKLLSETNALLEDYITPYFFDFDLITNLDNSTAFLIGQDWPAINQAG